MISDDSHKETFYVKITLHEEDCAKIIFPVKPSKATTAEHGPEPIKEEKSVRQTSIRSSFFLL